MIQIRMLVVLAAFLQLTTVLVGGTEVVCEPNIKVQRGCNVCTCSADGSNLSCTQNTCAPNLPLPPASGGTLLSGTDVVCRAGQAFKAECNNCRCSTLGNDIVCTRRLCLDSDN